LIIENTLSFPLDAIQDKDEMKNHVSSYVRGNGVWGEAPTKTTGIWAIRV